MDMDMDFKVWGNFLMDFLFWVLFYFFVVKIGQLRYLFLDLKKVIDLIDFYLSMFDFIIWDDEFYSYFDVCEYVFDLKVY